MTIACCDPKYCCFCDTWIEILFDKLCCGCCNCDISGCCDGVFDFIMCAKCFIFILLSPFFLIFDIIKRLISCALPLIIIFGLLWLLATLFMTFCGTITLILDLLAFGSNLRANSNANFVTLNNNIYYGGGDGDGNRYYYHSTYNTNLIKQPNVNHRRDRFNEGVIKQSLEYFEHSTISQKFWYVFRLQRGLINDRGKFSANDYQHILDLVNRATIIYNDHKEEITKEIISWADDKISQFLLGKSRTNTNGFNGGGGGGYRNLLQIGTIIDVLDCFISGGGVDILCLLGFLIDVPLDLPVILEELASFDCDCDGYNSSGCFSLDGLGDILTTIQTAISIVVSFFFDSIMFMIPEFISDILFLDGEADELPSWDDIFCAIINSGCLWLALGALAVAFSVLLPILEWICEIFKCLYHLRFYPQRKLLYQEYLDSFADHVYCIENGRDTCNNDCIRTKCKKKTAEFHQLPYYPYQDQYKKIQESIKLLMDWKKSSYHHEEWVKKNAKPNSLILSNAINGSKKSSFDNHRKYDSILSPNFPLGSSLEDPQSIINNEHAISEPDQKPRNRISEVLSLFADDDNDDDKKKK